MECPRDVWKLPLDRQCQRGNFQLVSCQAGRAEAFSRSKKTSCRSMSSAKGKLLGFLPDLQPTQGKWSREKAPATGRNQPVTILDYRDGGGLPSCPPSLMGRPWSCRGDKGQPRLISAAESCQLWWQRDKHREQRKAQDGEEKPGQNPSATRHKGCPAFSRFCRLQTPEVDSDGPGVGKTQERRERNVLRDHSFGAW